MELQIKIIARYMMIDEQIQTFYRIQKFKLLDKNFIAENNH